MEEKELQRKNSELNELLVEIIKNQKQSYKILARLFMVVSVCFAVVICTIVICVTWYESQFEYAIEYTDTMEQEVSGDGSYINNVEGNQYNDNATHNEGS